MYVETPQFYHIGIHYATPVDFGAVEKAIAAEALDWVRYASNCYIVFTNSHPSVICGRLMAVPGMNDKTFMILRCDLSGFAWLPGWIWEWLRRDRSQPNLLATPRVLPPGLG